MDEKKPVEPRPDPRVATFLCKHCAAVNQQAFPEVRVIVQKESCKCGVSSDSRIAKSWSTAAATAVSILILSAFGSCVADNYFTTEQIKSLPKDFTADKVFQGGLGPEYKVREMTPQEKERQFMTDRIQELEKQLKEKGAKPTDGK